MLKQKYGNGHWIGLTLGVCSRCFSIYHFVPFVFLMALVVFSAVALSGCPVPLAVLLVVYFTADILMSILAVKGQKKYWQYILLPIIFLSLHLAYGIGTLSGILKLPFWKRQIRRENK